MLFSLFASGRRGLSNSAAAGLVYSKAGGSNAQKSKVFLTRLVFFCFFHARTRCELDRLILSTEVGEGGDVCEQQT